MELVRLIMLLVIDLISTRMDAKDSFYTYKNTYKLPKFGGEILQN